MAYSSQLTFVDLIVERAPGYIGDGLVALLPRDVQQAPPRATWHGMSRCEVVKSHHWKLRAYGELEVGRTSEPDVAVAQSPPRTVAATDARLGMPSDSHWRVSRAVEERGGER